MSTKNEKLGLAGWKKEFYTVEARDKEATKSRLAAVKHSLRKWRGLTEENLSKYVIARDGSVIYDGTLGTFDQLVIDGTSCALCIKYAHGVCEKCPLYKVRGNVACDECMENEGTSPYRSFNSAGDPHPMIGWLEDALDYCKKRVKKRG